MYEQIEELKLYFQVIYLGIRETDGILTFIYTYPQKSIHPNGTKINAQGV